MQQPPQTLHKTDKQHNAEESAVSRLDHVSGHLLGTMVQRLDTLPVENIRSFGTCGAWCLV